MSLTSENNGTQFTIPMMPAGMGGYGMGGFGGDGGWWGILFIIAILCGGWGGLGGFGGMGGLMSMWPLLFGGFGNGFGGGGSAAAQGALTREQACIDNNFNNLARTTEGIARDLTALNSTICHQEYETAQLVNGVGNIVQQGFSQAELSRCNQQALLMQQLNQMMMTAQQCCCDTREAISGVNYNLSTQACDTRNTIQNSTRDIIDSQNSGFRAILDKMCQQEIAAKDAQIAAQNQQIFALQLGQSQAQQTAQIEARADARLNQVLHAINPPAVPAYPAPNPCGYNWNPAVLTNGYGFNGHNNGCGGCCNS